MHRVLIAGCKQEISSFNPVTCTYDDFDVVFGDDIIPTNEGQLTSVRGAADIFRAHGGVEMITTYTAGAVSAGPLEHSSFERIAREFLDSIKPHAGKIEGVYFSMHGSMGTTQELDPEGYLLEESRKILGEEVPIVISMDLHGVLTEKMCRHINGISMFHTYPHVDLAETGERAARLLLQILDGAEPVIARVTVPALVRGDELITETGCYGEQIRAVKQLMSDDSILGGGFLIGNPFTDVPELCSQAVIVTDGDEEKAAQIATGLAEDFWANRAKMQSKLVPLPDAVTKAAGMKGPVIFTDAADATSSGATGDSNAIIAEMVKQNYPHTALAPLVDAPAAEAAFDAGVGGTFRAKLGGSLDPRFKPMKMDVTVEMLSNGRFPLESWDTPLNSGPTAVLKSGNFTIIVTSRAVSLFDRSLFLAHGRDPQRFHSTVVKSPHCQPQFFDDWAEINLNVDAPGATSANLKSLGHKVCKRPIYPLDEGVTFEPNAEIYRR
ncbi:MAG: M81 family metallopeptidase [Dehalococcoidia bacterium]